MAGIGMYLQCSILGVSTVPSCSGFLLMVDRLHVHELDVSLLLPCTVAQHLTAGHLNTRLSKQHTHVQTMHQPAQC